MSCAVLLAGCDGPTAAGSTTPTSATPSITASQAGPPIQAAWWEWAAAEPTATNPVVDGTGVHCARNQPAGMWFLAGTFGDRARRRCTVSFGVPLVVPAVNLTSSDERDCRDFMADATGTIEFDGAPVPLERIEHEPITFTAGVGNPMTGDSGVTERVGCGLWSRIPAPTSGEHTVRIHGTSGTFEVTAEYILTVPAPSQLAVPGTSHSSYAP
jgi:hypothetical protein